MALMVKSRRVASWSCGPQTLSRSTRPLASTACCMPASCVLAGAFVAADLLGLAVVQKGAEGGDLDHLVLAPTAIDHVHDAKALADDEGAAKQALDLFGRGVGGHVESPWGAGPAAGRAPRRRRCRPRSRLSSGCAPRPWRGHPPGSGQCRCTLAGTSSRLPNGAFAGCGRRACPAVCR